MGHLRRVPRLRELDRRISGDMLGFQIAIDVLGGPDFPGKAAFEAAREFGVRVTSHTGVWNALGDATLKLVYDHGFMTPGRTGSFPTRRNAPSRAASGWPPTASWPTRCEVKPKSSRSPGPRA
jgi:hypothetical protein